MTLRAAVLLLALLAPSDKMLSIVISKVFSLFLKSKVTYWKNFNINLPYEECTGLGYCSQREITLRGQLVCHELRFYIPPANTPNQMMVTLCDTRLAVVL